MQSLQTPRRQPAPIRNIGIALAILSTLLAPPVRGAAPGRGLGINLSGIHYWSPALPFSDVFRQAGAWIPQREDSPAWNTGEPLDLSADGWVRSLQAGQRAATMLMSGNHYPAGNYQVAYDGRGELAFWLDARIIARKEGGLTLDVRPKAGAVAMKILRTDPADPVRNIRVYLPGREPEKNASVFNPDFIGHLRGYTVLRFMDWGNTNLDDTMDWAARTRPEHASQDRQSGVAIEHMLQLAAEVHADPWFNIPHAASDGHVREMARLVRDHLPPDRKCYVEYSNEVWNSRFPQHAHAAREARRLGLKDADAFYVRRSIEIFRIFETEFGGTSRLVRVLGGQAANTWRTKQLLQLPGLRGQVDAYAIAPYFGHLSQLQGQGGIQDLPGIPAPELMRRLDAGLDETRGLIRANVAMARSAGLPLIAYEAGQHVTNPPGQDAFCAGINRHPHMYDLYRRYLDIWSRETGGALMVLYADMSTYGRSGCWGLSERHGQPASETPKLRAVRDHLKRIGGR